MARVLISPTAFSAYAKENIDIWNKLEGRKINHRVWGNCVIEKVDLDASNIWVSSHKVGLECFIDEYFSDLYLPGKLGNEIIDYETEENVVVLSRLEKSNLAKHKERADKIQEYCQSRQIQSLVHFTQIQNLRSIFDMGLLSQDELNKKLSNEQRRYNDQQRLDGHRDAICTSISYPNYRMFYSLSSSNQSEWVILLINADVLWELDCAFCETNAASSAVLDVPLSERKKAEALVDLFGDYDYVYRKDLNIPNNYPTNPQAEVLVFNPIPTRFFQEVVFHDNLSLFQWILKNNPPQIQLKSDPSFFKPRIDWRRWRRYY